MSVYAGGQSNRDPAQTSASSLRGLAPQRMSINYDLGGAVKSVFQRPYCFNTARSGSIGRACTVRLLPVVSLALSREL